MTFISIRLVSWGHTGTHAQVPPSFDRNFARHLTDTTPDEEGRVETVFNICIDRNISLEENIRRMFYPNQQALPSGCSASRGGLLRDIIRGLGLSIIFIYLILAGVNFVLHHDDESKIKAAKQSFLYILYGGFIFLAVTWLLGTAITIDSVQGTRDLVEQAENRLFLQVLGFFKAAAFFVAILMIVYYGYRIMMAMDQEEKIKNARSGIVNVIIMLVFIKIIDYVFFISMSEEFLEKAKLFIIDIARTLGFVMGALFIASIVYAGFLMITSQADEDKIRKAKNIVVSIFFSALVIFIFLLIIYQVISEFT